MRNSNSIPKEGVSGDTGVSLGTCTIFMFAYMSIYVYVL